MIILIRVIISKLPCLYLWGPSNSLYNPKSTITVSLNIYLKSKGLKFVHDFIVLGRVVKRLSL